MCTRAWECVYIWICVCVCDREWGRLRLYLCVHYKYMLVREDNQICWKVQCSACLVRNRKKKKTTKKRIWYFFCGIGFLASFYLSLSLTLHLRSLYFYPSCNLWYTLFYWQHIAGYLNLHSTNDRLSKHTKRVLQLKTREKRLTRQRIPSEKQSWR